jgi:hypothetical protein
LKSRLLYELLKLSETNRKSKNTKNQQHEKDNLIWFEKSYRLVREKEETAGHCWQEFEARRQHYLMCEV